MNFDAGGRLLPRCRHGLRGGSALCLGSGGESMGAAGAERLTGPFSPLKDGAGLVPDSLTTSISSFQIGIGSKRQTRNLNENPSAVVVSFR